MKQHLPLTEKRLQRALGLIMTAMLLVAQAQPAISAPLAGVNGSWSWPSGMGLTGSVVYALLVHSSGNVYMGGSFTNAGGDSDCDYVAIWTGSAFDCPSGMSLNDNVYVLREGASGSVYAAGLFTDAGGDTTADRIARWSGSAWGWDGASPGGPVFDLAFDGASLYVAGSFTDAGGDLDADYIALWNESTDSWSWPSGKGLNAFASVLLLDGSNLYVSGSFGTSPDDADCVNLCLWNETTDTWSWPSAGTVFPNSMAWNGSLLYAGGVFTDGGDGAGGIDDDCDRICLWNENTDTWSWPGGMGLGDGPRTLVLDAAGYLYAGGDFVDAGSDADADYIARWNESAGSWSWSAGMGLNGIVASLAADGNLIYAGGSFDNAGGDADADGIALFTPDPLLFADGFESGDFSAWTNVNIGNGNLTVCGAAASEGSYGMCAASTNNKRKQVIDSVPDDELRYYASFTLDPNGITIGGAANRIRVFQGRMDTAFPFIVLLRYISGTYQVRLRLANDDGSYVDTAWWTITDAPHTIGVDWRKDSIPGAIDGFGALYIDNTWYETINLVDNDMLAIRGTRLGITSRMDGVTMTSTLYFDDFYSDSDGYPE